MTYQQRLARQLTKAVKKCEQASFPYGFEAYAKAVIETKQRRAKYQQVEFNQ